MDASNESIEEIDGAIEKEKLDKMILVYLNQAYPDSYTKELIYKTPIPFYLYLKQTHLASPLCLH